MIDIDDYIPLQYPGPLSRQRTFRLKLAWLLIAALGFGIGLFAESPHLQSFGLGLIFPGAGFIHYAAGSWVWILLHAGLVLLTIILFLVALFVWFWNGNLLAPIAVWLLAALFAGWMDHSESLGIICSVRVLGKDIPAAPLISILLAGLAIAWGQSLINRGTRKRVATLARRRAAIGPILIPESPLGAAGGREVKEMTRADLAALRFAFDRALQPVDAWQGFYFGDQWQPAATRYQVNTLGWALALANHNSLPAMRGYLQQAQLNLIEKKKDHKLWWYWRWENLWGNLRLNADPMPIDNIMYSGYLAMQIGMYQAVTGDLRHDRPAAFTLKHPNGDEYVYAFPRIAQIVARQFDSDYCLWPCEPNMIYPLCNVFGAIGVAAYDAAHGTEHWARIEPRFRAMLRHEFTHVDGTIIPLKSGYTGLPLIGGGMSSLLSTAAWISPLMPDLAAAQWAMAKAELFDRVDGACRLKNEKDLIFPDPGSYKSNYAFSLSSMLMAAAEMGDREVHALGLELLERLMPAIENDGVLRHADASVWAHAQLMIGRIGHTHGLHDLVRNGASRQWREGPLLTEARYPEVLVAKAVSDGAALELVLYSGGGNTRQDITVAQLKPGLRYRLTINGAEAGGLVADGAGKCIVPLQLGGRTGVFLAPNPA